MSYAKPVIATIHSGILKLAGLAAIVGLIATSCGGGDATSTAGPVPTQTPRSAPSATAAPTPTPAPAVAPSTATSGPRPSPTAAVPTPPGPAPRYGGTFRMRLLSDFAVNMDVRLGNIGQASVITGTNFLNTLIAYQPEDTSKIEGEVAERWEAASDGTVWTFALRRDVLWQDGKPLTSRDVLFTLDSFINPENPNATTQKAKLGAIDKMEAPDEYTVRITLKRVSASFVNVIDAPWMFVYPAHLPFFQDAWKKQPLGSGAFKWDSRTPGVVISMVRNPSYFKKDVAGRSLPYLDRLEQYIIPDRGVLLGAFATGRLDCLCMFSSDLFVEDIPLLKARVPDAKTSIGRAGTSVVMYFGKKRPLDNLKVRQAIHIGVDRKEVNAAFALGLGYYPPHLIIPESLGGGPWAIPDQEVLQMPGFREPKDQDRAQAKALLKEAGLDPSATSLTVLTLPKFSSLAESLDAQLVSLGFTRSKISLQGDTAARIQQLRNGDYDIYLSEQPLFVDPGTTLVLYVTSQGTDNHAHWAFPQIDDLMVRQDHEPDPAKRRDVLREFQRTLYDLAYDVPLVYQPIGYAVHGYVEGFPMNRVLNVSPGLRVEKVWYNK